MQCDHCHDSDAEIQLTEIEKQQALEVSRNETAQAVALSEQTRLEAVALAEQQQEAAIALARQEKARKKAEIAKAQSEGDQAHKDIEQVENVTDADLS